MWCVSVPTRFTSTVVASLSLSVKVLRLLVLILGSQMRLLSCAGLLAVAAGAAVYTERSPAGITVGSYCLRDVAATRGPSGARRRGDQ